MTGRHGSVRFRLALSFAAALAVLLALFSTGVYALARRHLLAEVDNRARADLSLVQRELEEDPEEAFKIEKKGLLIRYCVSRASVPIRASAAWSRSGLPHPASFPPDGAIRRFAASDGRSFAVVAGTTGSGDEAFEIAVAQDEASARGALSDLATTFALGIPLGIAAAFLTGWVLSGRLLAPVGKMAEAAFRITEERLSERLPVADAGDEFGRLATAFNQTLSRLELAFEKTRRFTSDASHELRTPLTALKSVGETALRKQPSPEGFRETIVSMLEEADRLAHLVDGLLLLTREDTDVYRSRFARLDLGRIAEEVVGVLRVLAEERGQKIDTRIDPGVFVTGDRTTLRQAVFNLLDNAIKYTPQGGTIRVEVRSADGGEASLQVVDNGPGIASEHRERIFERFYRIESDRSRATGGSGLGLSIARWAVELHGGRLGLESEEGKGSAFQFRVPLAAGPAGG